jgi:hypothetical protein
VKEGYGRAFNSVEGEGLRESSSGALSKFCRGACQPLSIHLLLTLTYRNEFMNKVEKLFLNKAIQRGGVLLFSKKDALEFVAECRRQNVQVLGIDGFYLTEKSTQPSMDNSIDYSSNFLSKEWNVDPIQFLIQLGDDMYFEIVCAD